RTSKGSQAMTIHPLFLMTSIRFPAHDSITRESLLLTALSQHRYARSETIRKWVLILYLTYNVNKALEDKTVYQAPVFEWSLCV
ncbi:MAG TPA: hypothetical protein VNE38_01780, partial [Ktedonobacteraceae bacterium]|nr:hypothetical protein [Ktedonobacteraceae bacterium]